MGVLSFALSNWKLIAYGILALAAVGFVLWAKHEYWDLPRQELAAETQAYNTEVKAYTAMKSAYDQVSTVNRQNAATCAAELSAAGQNVVIANQERAAANARAINFGKITNAIKNAPPAGAVDPVIRSTVDSLWDDK